MRVKLKLDRAGIREAALTSREVRAAVARAAEAIAARAASVTDDEIEVVHAGRSRARSYVRRVGADAAANEAHDRALGRAIGGG